MFEGRWLPSRVLDGTEAGHFGKSRSTGLVVERLDELGLATVTARRGCDAALSEAVLRHYGIESPTGPRWVQGTTVGMAGCGLGHWLAVSSELKYGALCADLVSKLDPFATICDQSDGRVVLRIQGPRVREVLAKCIPIDLHPRAFCPGIAASTVTGHIAVQLWQRDESPTYELVVLRSFASSLWSWLRDCAAPFGCELRL